jgi:hypothetical protein
MHIKKIPKRALRKAETIFEYEARLKKEAVEISKSFTHVKPTKYLLK